MTIFDEVQLESRLKMVRGYVAKPIPAQPWKDERPCLVPFAGDDRNDFDDGRAGIIIGGARHAANPKMLASLGCRAVLNCASGGIARLPIDELREKGIRYEFTNCRSDSYTYPLLHEKKRRPEKLENRLNGTSETEEQYICSNHLEVANSLFVDIMHDIGKKGDGSENERDRNVLFFCVAGQNRSAGLAVGVLLLHGMNLEKILSYCAEQRSFVLENLGFQRQIVELEAIIQKLTSPSATEELRCRFGSHWKLLQHVNAFTQQSKRVRMCGTTRRPPDTGIPSLLNSQFEILNGTKVEVELLIPGLCSLEVRVPIESTIPEVKEILINEANEHVLRHDKQPCMCAKTWLVLAQFGKDDMYDIPLEVEAVERKVQLEKIRSMFGLTSRLKDGEWHVTWTSKCRFALVIFSVILRTNDDGIRDSDPALSSSQVPWTFVHEERKNAPATLLENTLRSTHLRAWDFVSGSSLASKLPIVFSFADDSRDKRAFMQVSRSANEMQQFKAPGEGDILGMGNNAIVHRVQLAHTFSDGRHRDEHWTSVNIGLEVETSLDRSEDNVGQATGDWDAAVKRPFDLHKMIAFLQHSSEAGLAKRLRAANKMNADKRILYFHGLGVGISTNAYNANEYKFELMLLSKYEENFSTYTMRRFLDEYTKSDVSSKMQEDFSITGVKILLVSLLNAFRDLTLMGIESFDFNHLNNVLVSRDFTSVRLIDIDGNSQGSIHYPTLTSSFASPNATPTSNLKPSLNVDLNILLPAIVEQLVLGKGRGTSFVANKRSEIWRVDEAEAKRIIRSVVLENFYPQIRADSNDEATQRAERHALRIAEWFYSLLKKRSPWSDWTVDIYNAMRCIDHLPIA